MDQPSLQSALADLKLPAIRFFPSIGSTNDEAWRWVEAGAPERALVIADEQTAGRGHLDHHWVTYAGSGLAFSLVLRSLKLAPQHVQRLTALAALAICSSLHTKYALAAEIKWPNDVLVNQGKVAGVLVETRWDGQHLDAAVIGIGINIAPSSVSAVNLPAAGLLFPATCVEDALGHPVDRLELLHATLQEFFLWLQELSSQKFMAAWEANLAYHDQWVELFIEHLPLSSPRQDAPAPVQVGKVIGLGMDGSLKIRSRSGELITAQVGEIHLRPTRSDQLSH